MKTYRRTTIIKKYKFFFKSIDGSVAEYFDVELILLACCLLHPKPAPEQAWSIVTGLPCWDERKQTFAGKKAINYLNRHYKYINKFSRESAWKDILGEYRKLPEEYRLFWFDESEEKWGIQKPKKDVFNPNNENDLNKVLLYLNECAKKSQLKERQRIQWVKTKYTLISNIRLFVYYHLLKDVPTHKEPKENLITSGKYYYLGDNQKSEISFEIETNDKWFKTLPIYRQKKQWVRKINEDERIAIGQEMDKLTNKLKWEKQARRSKLTSGRKREATFTYSERYVHIAGGVGVGKNAFIEEEVYRFLKKENRDDTIVCVVVNTNSRALELHNQFCQLDLPATIIPGVYGKKKHEDDYIEKMFKEAEDFNDILKNEQTLSVADSDCLFRIYHQVDINERNLPCAPFNRFRVERGGELEKSPCPYFMECGLMKCYRLMKETNIWITTPYALKSTVIPEFVDAEKRTLQQLIYDLADVVYIDEVDEAMSIYDRDCVEETIITGDVTQLIPRLQEKTFRAVTNNQRLLEKEQVHQWTNILNDLQKPVHDINGFIRRQSNFTPSLEKRNFTLFGIGSQLIEYVLFEDESEKKLYHEWMQEFLTDESGSDEDKRKAFIKALDSAITNINQAQRDTSKLMKHAALFFEQMQWIINPRKKSRRVKSSSPEERACLHLIFFAHLYELEKHLRMIINQYPKVSSFLKLTDDQLIYLFGKKNKLFNLIPDVVTGSRFGYRLTKQTHDGRYRLSVIRYYGYTRLLLTQSNQLLSGTGIYRVEKNFFPSKGPCIIGLSGTSYAPGSPHFDVPLRPVLKLVNQQDVPSIECFKAFIPSEHQDYDYVYVSGTTSVQREKMLRELTIMYDDYIENELVYWKSREGRKVLIVVNSYSDALIVADELGKKNKWKGRFRFVYRDDVENVSEVLLPHMIHPSQIEQVAEQEIDLLISPLSVIARGYNILQNIPGRTHRSYFGTACLFVRPYYVVDDIENAYILLHSQMEETMNRLKTEQKIYAEYVKSLYREMNYKLRYLLTKPFTMKSLNKKELEELCWMTFILVQQLLGRLMRGDTPARLLIADAKMDCIVEDKRGLKEHTSMIDMWIEILDKHSKNDVVQTLYGPFYNGLKNIKEYTTDHY